MTKPSPSERIEIVRRTREGAATALSQVLRRCDASASELDISQAWIREMGKIDSVSANGWYQPPPGGTSIMIGHPTDSFSRMNYDSLRLPAAWPRDDISLTDECLIYAYASPFDIRSGMIGDIGITLYKGDRRSVQEHLSMCLELTARIAKFAEVGMELRELFNYAQRSIMDAGMANHTSSTHARQQNIGHTIPWTYEECPQEVAVSLERGILRDVREVISRHRIQIDSSSKFRIRPTMALTVEPQLASPRDPLCSYHVIVAFSDGRKEIVHAFDSLFDHFGMDGDMEKVLASLPN